MWLWGLVHRWAWIHFTAAALQLLALYNYWLCNISYFSICDNTFIYVLINFVFILILCVKVLDVGFSLLSVVSLLVHHCPIASTSQASLVIASLGLLIPLVANNPTNIFNTIIAFSWSSFVLFFSWLCVIVSFRYNKKSEVVGYEQILSISNHNGVDNNTTSLQHTSSTFSLETERESSHNNQKESVIFIKLRVIYSCIYLLRYTILGTVLALLGILCFVKQDRISYWYLHSFWHIFIMGSSYPLLKGRNICVSFFFNKFIQWWNILLS